MKTAWTRGARPRAAGVLGVVLSLVAALVTLAEAQPYQGFGAGPPGGIGGTTVHVTNLNNSGPGSLREAVSQGNRTVVFDVGGEIVLTDYVYVLSPFVTIDGSTAPSPGMTLRNRGLVIRGNRGAHDVIGFRSRPVRARPRASGPSPPGWPSRLA